MSLAAFRGHAATLPSRVQPHGIGMSRRYPPRAGLGNLRACCLPSLWNTVGRCPPLANSVYAGTPGPQGSPFTDGIPGAPAPYPGQLQHASRRTERFSSLTERSGLSVLVSNRGPGLPCTAPVADDSVADKIGFDPRHRVSSVIFESFLAP